MRMAAFGTAIHKFLLLDTRYSDSRRKVVFNRETDDWSKVQGMLRVTIQPTVKCSDVLTLDSNLSEISGSPC